MHIRHGMTETIMDYLYDGSFEGFLCCVYLHYYEEKASGIYVQTRYQNKLFQPYKIVDTNYERAERVYEAIESKISSRALKRVYYLLLSNYEEKENIALNYLRLGFRLGAKVDSYHSHPAVYEAQQVARKVANEAHRLAGLVRFSVLRVNRTTMYWNCWASISPIASKAILFSFTMPREAKRFTAQPGSGALHL
jgi:probable DNA metabolism protein